MVCTKGVGARVWWGETASPCVSRVIAVHPLSPSSLISVPLSPSPLNPSPPVPYETKDFERKLPPSALQGFLEHIHYSVLAQNRFWKHVTYAWYVTYVHSDWTTTWSHQGGLLSINRPVRLNSLYSEGPGVIQFHIEGSLTIQYPYQG